MSEDESVKAPLKQTRKRTLSSKSMSERSPKSNSKKKNTKESKKEKKGFYYLLIKCLYALNPLIDAGHLLKSLDLEGC